MRQQCCLFYKLDQTIVSFFSKLNDTCQGHHKKVVFGLASNFNDLEEKEQNE